jgi:hypothetical protein
LHLLRRGVDGARDFWQSLLKFANRRTAIKPSTINVLPGI